MPESEHRGPDGVGPDDPGQGPTQRQADLDRGETLRPLRPPTAPSDNLGKEETIRGRKPGDKVFNGRYELKRILGRGGMGVVWLALDKELDHEVALKFLPEVMAYNEAAILELKRETKKALLLTHPHIVRIHGWERDAENAAVSMEYVDGRTLAELKAERENGCLEVADIREWVRQLCEAMEYAHTKAKVVHRDLKPQNLMVNSKGDLKITDFGISRSLEESVSKTTRGGAGFSGTLSYMSPQQLESKPTEPADDLYALGATIYELLTGKPPFYGGDVSRLIREVVPPSVAERRRELGVDGGEAIPEAWEKTIAACLAKEPSQRPASAEAVWGGLEEQRISRQGTKYTKQEQALGGDDTPGRPEPEGKDQSLTSAPTGEGGRAGVPGAGRLEAGDTAGRRPAVQEAEVRAATQHRPTSKGKWLTVVAVVAVVFVAWWRGPGRKGANASAVPKGGSNVVAVPPVQVPAAGTNWLAQAPAKPDEAQVRREVEAKAKSEGEAAAKVLAQREAEEHTKHEAALAVGGVKFTTEPTGARVQLGQDSKISPADFAALKPGKYPYVIELAGYESEQGQVEIAGGVDRQMPVFALVGSKGDLAIEVDPGVASYEVLDSAGNRVSKGVGSGEIKGLAVGQYQVRIVYTGLGEATQTVKVKGEAKAVVKLALPYGALKVTSEPKGARILLDGKGMGETPQTLQVLKPGSVSVGLELLGYEAVTLTGTVAEGRVIELAGTLEYCGPKTGGIITNGTGMEMVWIAPGNFVMGSSTGVPDRSDDEGPQTEVILSRVYGLGRHEVTQAEFEAVMGRNPSAFKGKDLPVETVRWGEAMGFCRRLTELESAAGKLP